MAWYQTKALPFLLGALFMAANWVWTLLVIKRANDPLMRAAPEDAGGVSRALIVKWNALHFGANCVGGRGGDFVLFGLSWK